MDNLRDLVELFDGHLYKSLLGTALFAETFERAFDKALGGLKRRKHMSSCHAPTCYRRSHDGRLRDAEGTASISSSVGIVVHNGSTPVKTTHASQ